MMAPMPEQATRACGLYRTTRTLPGHDEVGPGRLVYYHNHSEQGPPIVLLPEANTNNRWSFHRQGYLVTDADFTASLEALKPEGLYRLREHFHPDAERTVAANALVQLGYNASASPIIFFPTLRAEDNAWVFPTSGMGIPAQVYELLEPLDTRGPFRPVALH